ncbi:unnamed protein product [Chilo suppressalis]|uniref:Chitin-binding type-2 domain-containing protein n=1 Tax=Chilo suppressalis TaxID=168631 RepID=A0ABN8L5V5_CHISP|nr:unnamed protein product [Chilo suppressalis]
MKKPLILCHLLLVAAMAADIPSDDYKRFWNTAPTIMPSTIVSSSSSRPTTSRPPTTPPPTCPPGYVGNVPHPDFCNQFFWCSAWGRPNLNTCQAGFEFDPALRTCVRIAPGGCTLSRPSSTTQRPTTPGSFTTEDFEVSTNPPITDPPKCPPGFVGNMPYPHICNAYFTCNEWGGTSTMRYCSAGFEFDPTLRICVRIAPGGCTLGGTTAATAATDVPSTPGSRPTTSRPPTTPPPTCPPGYVGNVPHPDFCNQFFWCSAWGRPNLNTCQAGFEFDPALRTCVRISPGGCTLSRPSSTTQRPTTPGSFTTEDFEVSTNPPITDPPKCPPGFVGNMPYPHICNAYFTCNEWGGTSTMRYCSAGFEFDPTLRICVRIAPGGCTLGGTTAATAATDVPSTPVFSTSGGFEVTTVLSSTSAPPAPSSCASGFMGTVPHPDLCNSFFMCLGSAAIQMYCTSGHEYDAQLRTCVQLAPGGCTLGNVTTESP